MVRNLIKLLVVVLSLALLGGCATVIKPIPAQDLNPKLKSGALVQKTNNFQVIMDQVPIEGLNQFEIKQKDVYFKGLCPDCHKQTPNTQQEGVT